MARLRIELVRAIVDDPVDDGKDVHTEHCCLKHGCKYGWTRAEETLCTVATGRKPQSHMCEYCSDWLEDNWDVVLLLNEMWDRGYARGLSVVEVL